jgi:hypothetical protein
MNIKNFTLFNFNFMQWKWFYILLLFDNLYFNTNWKSYKKKDLFKLQTKKFVKYLLL